MLSVNVIDTEGKITEGLVPQSLTLLQEEGVPADSVELVLNETELKPMAKIEVYRNESLIFSGEIDEQIKELSRNPHTELVARSSGARLIDSEAYPMSFVNPSAEDIFAKYAAPFGFAELKGENKVCLGKFTVSKGTSCFAVIKAFAKEVYGAFPRIENNRVYIDGKRQKEVLVLSNSDGIPYEKVRIANLRCNRISKVCVKLFDGEGYTHEVADRDAENMGINKVRYLNATADSSASLKDADEILKSAEIKSFYAEVFCRGFYADSLGKNVECSFGTDLYVSAVKYILSKSGEVTRLTLKKRSS